MTDRLLIENDPHQTRVAVLEDDRLTEIYHERRKLRGVVGNVYKGRVSRVLPGMQAAFVDIGLTRDAFLYAGDVRDALADRDELVEADPQTGEFQPQEVRSIEELLSPGQDLIVQVVKEPLTNKGARITTEITLPGRYAVLVPTVPSVGVSRRIRDPEERERLRAILHDLDLVEHGLIVRTAGEGQEREAFEADLRYLTRTWSRIRHEAGTALAPALLHGDHDLALRVIRDRMTDGFGEILVEGRDAYERIVSFAEEIEPEMVGRIKEHTGDGTLFDLHGIESDLGAALKSRVWLKSGGYLVINQTEALVAIDINTGRFVGRKNLEDTVVRTNLEAVEEIVRQIRLRDLSGIIVIDFIDMSEPDHRTDVFEALQEELRKDRAKNQVLSLSDFGLVEITRKRSRTSLERQLTRACPHCGGDGRILSVPTVCLNLRREVLRRRETFASGGVRLRVHPEILKALETDHHDVLDELETTIGCSIRIESSELLHHEHFDIVDAG